MNTATNYLPRIEFYISLAQNYKKSKLNTSINKGNFQVPVFYYEIHKKKQSLSKNNKLKQP